MNRGTDDTVDLPVAELTLKLPATTATATPRRPRSAAQLASAHPEQPERSGSAVQPAHPERRKDPHRPKLQAAAAKPPASACGEPSAAPLADPAADPADRLSKTALAKRILAWHNRHPLARTWRTAHVAGAGLVAIPFSAPPHGAGAEAKAAKPYAMLDDLKLGPGLAAADVLAFAVAHGWAADAQASRFAGWPIKHLPVAAGWNADQACHVLLPVVQVQVPGQQRPLRFVVGQGAHAESPLAEWPVLGPRQWSRWRLGLAGLLASAVLVAGLAWLAPQIWALIQRPPAAERSEVQMQGQGQGQALPQTEPLAPTTPHPPRRTNQTSPRAAAQAPAAPNGTPHSAGATAPPATPAMAQPAERIQLPGLGANQRSFASKGGPGAPIHLIGAAGADQEDLHGRLAKARAAVLALGPLGRSLQVEVVGTPEGDAISIWPLHSPADADRVAALLAQRGIPMRVAEPSAP